VTFQQARNAFAAAPRESRCDRRGTAALGDRAGNLARPVFKRVLEPLPAPAAATASTTTATASASATITIAAATTAAGTGPLFARLVHLDIAAFELGAIELRDCTRRFIGIGHLHEAEAARLAGELVGYNRDTIDLSDLPKQRFQIFIGHGKG
jgi:hypothetical protein